MHNAKTKGNVRRKAVQIMRNVKIKANVRHKAAIKAKDKRNVQTKADQDQLKATTKTAIKITMATKTAITVLAAIKTVIKTDSTKRKKGKQQQSNKPAVPPRKFRELPEVLEYTEGMNVADIAKKSIANQLRSSRNYS